MTMNSAIAERARAGELLTAAELDELATVDVLTLGMLADEVRDYGAQIVVIATGSRWSGDGIQAATHERSRWR